MDLLWRVLEVVASVFLRNLESENDLRGKLAYRKCFNGLFCSMESCDLENLGGEGKWDGNVCLIALFGSRIW